MKNKLIVVAFSGLVIAGCTKEDPSWPPVEELKATFVPVWNGAPFDKNNVYLSPANERVLLQQVKFYLSRLTLIGKEGESLLSEVELLDITNGPLERTFQVPVDSYDSLRFGLGLPVDMNHADITQIPPASPLGAAQGMYWTWTTMYRFMIFDGRFDTDPDATGPPPYQYSIHSGRDECYRQRTVTLPLRIIQNGGTELEFEVDLAQFFGDGSVVLDLSQGSQSHGAVQELYIAERLSDLAVKAITPH